MRFPVPLPFIDVLYIRCDWRDVQISPGKLQLSPVWEATSDAAKRHNLGVGFRIQLSSPNIQPQKALDAGLPGTAKFPSSTSATNRKRITAILISTSRATTPPNFKKLLPT